VHYVIINSLLAADIMLLVQYQNKKVVLSQREPRDAPFDNVSNFTIINS